MDQSFQEINSNPAAKNNNVASISSVTAMPSPSVATASVVMAQISSTKTTTVTEVYQKGPIPSLTPNNETLRQKQVSSAPLCTLKNMIEKNNFLSTASTKLNFNISRYAERQSSNQYQNQVDKSKPKTWTNTSLQTGTNHLCLPKNLQFMNHPWSPMTLALRFPQVFGRKFEHVSSNPEKMKMKYSERNNMSVSPLPFAPSRLTNCSFMDKESAVKRNQMTLSSLEEPVKMERFKLSTKRQKPSKLKPSQEQQAFRLWPETVIKKKRKISKSKGKKILLERRCRTYSNDCTFDKTTNSLHDNSQDNSFIHHSDDGLETREYECQIFDGKENGGQKITQKMDSIDEILPNKNIKNNYNFFDFQSSKEKGEFVGSTKIQKSNDSDLINTDQFRFYNDRTLEKCSPKSKEMESMLSKCNEKTNKFNLFMEGLREPSHQITAPVTNDLSPKVLVPNFKQSTPICSKNQSQPIKIVLSKPLAFGSPLSCVKNIGENKYENISNVSCGSSQEGMDISNTYDVESKPLDLSKNINIKDKNSNTSLSMVSRNKRYCVRRNSWFSSDFSISEDSPGKLCIDLDATQSSVVKDNESEKLGASDQDSSDETSAKNKADTSNEDNLETKLDKILPERLPLKKRRLSETLDNSSFLTKFQNTFNLKPTPKSNDRDTKLLDLVSKQLWHAQKGKRKNDRCKKCFSDYRATSLVRCPVCPNNTLPNFEPNSNTQMRSLSSLPYHVILSRKSNNTITVVANAVIKSHTLLGPLEGELTTIEKISSNCDVSYLWPIHVCKTNSPESSEKCLIISNQDEGKSNWLRYIHVGKDLSEYNLAMIHKQDTIFFITVQRIAAGQELILRPFDPLLMQTNLAQETICCLCNVFFPSPLHLAKHRFFFHTSLLQTDEQNTRLVSTPKGRRGSGEIATRRGSGEIATRRGSVEIATRRGSVEIATPECQTPKTSQNQGEKFGSKNDTNDLNVKSQQPSQWHCEDCHSYFKSKAGYSAHVSIVHKRHEKTSDQVFRCRHCDRIFQTSWSLHCHVKSHTFDKVGSEIFTCQECGRTFFRKRSYKRHIQAHEANALQMTPACEHCGRRFYSSSNLKVHMLTHSGVKPFQCKVNMCGVGFTTKQSLQFHYIKRHGFIYENMPFIERNVPFTFQHYCGGQENGNMEGEVDHADKEALQDYPIDYRLNSSEMLQEEFDADGNLNMNLKHSFHDRYEMKNKVVPEKMQLDVNGNDIQSMRNISTRNYTNEGPETSNLERSS